MKSVLIDMTGQRFGRLVAQSRIPYDPKTKYTLWKCICDCGNEIITHRASLIGGQTKSCGCLMREINSKIHTTHGLGKTREYQIWLKMVERCHKIECASYKYYGGIGIKVCERWREACANFIADMGPSPSLQHSLDRIDVYGNYEPGNCRWATQEEQSFNRKANYPTILALDIATNTGWAVGRVNDPKPLFGTKTFKPQDDSLGAFGQEIDMWLHAMLNAHKPKLVVFEAPILPAKTRIQTLRRLYGLAAHVEFVCCIREIECLEADIGSIKKYVTGHGHASKDDMVHAIRRYGFAVANDNEADAVGLRMYTIGVMFPEHAARFPWALGNLGATA